ncbi:MAG TPA: type II toxin-antitoxin system VapC family toxin [Gemmatimonadaceae bacterium]
MNVVDSSAWLEYFADGPQAVRFAAPIEATRELIVPTMVLLEVTRRILQQRDEDTALRVAAQVHRGRVVDLDSGLVLSAARLGVRYGLSAVESIVLATARRYDATLWTMDPAFEGLEKVRVIPRSG